MLKLNDRLAQIRQNHLLRQRLVATGKTHVRRTLDGKNLLSFCNNDYLGLASDARVIAAFEQGAREYGVGTAASSLITGYTRAHQALEEALAEHTRRSRALLFSSGYLANLGVIQALAKRGQTVLCDRLNHASLMDGVRLSQARLQRYPHRDFHAAEKMLRENPIELVVSDSLFSMDGTCAPMKELARLCRTHRCPLMIDDAHGFGVYGAEGGGTLSHFELDQQAVPILMATLGKACGVGGAFVAGADDLIEFLLQQTRTHLYTTAPPAAMACAAASALQIIRKEPERRARLFTNIAHFEKCLREAGLHEAGLHEVTLPHQRAPDTLPSAIHPLIVHDSERALNLSRLLWKDGIAVSAIRPPTVPVGEARLRITLSSQHGEDDIERLVASLAQHVPAVMHPAKQRASAPRLEPS